MKIKTFTCAAVLVAALAALNSGPSTAGPERAGKLPVQDDRQVAIELGEMNDYAIRVDSPLGTFPVEDNQIELVVDDSVVGTVEHYDVVIDGVMPQPLVAAATSVASEPDTAGSLTFEVDVTGFRVIAAGGSDDRFYVAALVTTRAVARVIAV